MGGAPQCPCGGVRARTILRAERFCLYGQTFEDHAYTLRRCWSCGLVRTEPRPAEHQHELFRDPSFLETYLERESLFERFLAPVVGIVTQLAPPPSRLLDIGANTGTLVRLASEAGYDAEGLELNEAAVSFASDRGLKVRAASLDDAGYEPDTFGAITMSAVAEHLLDLDGTLAAAAEALKPGGVLVVANSPNIRSLAWVLERGGWYGLQPQGHAWQLSPATLRAALERAGFRVVRSETFGMHRDFGRNRKQRLKRTALRIAEHLGFGDAVTLAAIKS